MDGKSCYHHNAFDFSQSQHRITWACKGSKRKSSVRKLLQFGILKTKQRFFLNEQVKVLKRNSIAYSVCCTKISKLFTELASACRFPYRTQKVRLDIQNRKRVFLLISMQKSMNFQMDTFTNSCVSETVILASFKSKSVSYTVIILSLRK